jgi:choline kinase
MASQAVRNISKIKKTNFNQNLIVILSAGDNPDMKSYGPRSTLKYDNETLLERQYRLLHAQFPDSPVVVVHGHQYPKTIDKAPFGVANVVNESYNTTGVVKSLLLGMAVHKHTGVLFLHGDLLFNRESIKFALKDNSFVVVDNDTMTKTEVGVVIIDNTAVNFMYDLSPKWAQIAYLTGKELLVCRQLFKNTPIDKLKTFELLNLIISSGGVFKIQKIKNGIICDIDTPSDLRNAENLI